jgi:hypothetical protein
MAIRKKKYLLSVISLHSTVVDASIQIGLIDVENECSKKLFKFFPLKSVSFSLIDSRRLNDPFSHQTEPCCCPEPDTATIDSRLNSLFNFSKANSRACKTKIKKIK